MADNNRSGGKKGRKIGRNAEKCKKYRMRHGGGDRKKFRDSKEHRGCNPLGYYLRGHKSTGGNNL